MAVGERTGGGRLAGKVAIVTGGAANSRGAGIGLAIAELFGGEGARVVVADIAPDGRLTAERIAAVGGEAVAVQADLTERAGAERVVGEALARFGRLDILVNVVGGSLGEGEFLDVDDELWRRIVDVNARTAHLCCQVAVPAMARAGGGSLVHIATTNALLGCPGLATYSGVKAGLIGFSRVLAARFGPEGIRSNVVCPGIMGEGEPDRRQPLGRTATPRDIAYAALFLASEEAAFITGQVLAVDGGHTTTYPEVF